MDIRTINTFVKAVELGSFTKAADELNYVQSTVTMQIQQLEKDLGYPLFDRIGNKLSITSYGIEFLNYAYEILHTVKKAEMIGKNTVSDLSCHYIHKEYLVFISSPNHPLANRHKIPFPELMQYRFLVTEREGICYGRLKELSAQYQASVNDSVEIDNISVITELVAKGMGLPSCPNMPFASIPQKES